LLGNIKIIVLRKPLLEKCKKVFYTKYVKKADVLVFIDEI
jgi:hypothetical protein